MSLNTSSPLSFSSVLKGRFVVTLTFAATKLLLVVPLSAFVLRLGLRQWRSVKISNHPDVFSFHLAAIELLWCPGFLFFLCGETAGSPGLITASSCMFVLTFQGEFLFHCLTCVDWHLAVVHPMFYLRLKQARWATVKRMSVVLDWLLCVGLSLVNISDSTTHLYNLMLCSFTTCLVVITFCAASVLRALIRPGPGQVSVDKVRMDQLKRRAFYTVSVISGVLWVSFAGLLICLCLLWSFPGRKDIALLLSRGLQWFSLPAGLVSPLQYLHRAGKLSFSCHADK